MKIIKLPNGVKYELEANLTIEEKIILVQRLTDEWQYEIDNNWTSNGVIFFLEGLSNYLVWHREEEEKNKWHRDILSEKKTRKLSKYSKDSKEILFTDLSKKEKALLLGDGEVPTQRCYRINDSKEKTHVKGNTLFDKGRRIMANYSIKKTVWCLVDTENEFSFDNKKFKIDDSVEQYLVKNKSSVIYNYENSAKMERILAIKLEDDSIRFFDERYTEINKSLVYKIKD